MGEVLSQNEIDSLLQALNITEDSCQPIFLFIYGKMFRLR